MTVLVEASIRPSRELLTACAAFGVATRWEPRRRGSGRAGGTGVMSDRERRAREVAAVLDATLPAGGVALVTGPSGAGKSTILSALMGILRARSCPAVVIGARGDAKRGDTSVADALRGPVRRRLSLLAAAGLAEATLLPRRVSELSDGQRFRLRLAVGMQRALSRTGVATLMVDEFAASLDRVTARSVSCTLARWVRRERRVRLVAATAHDDVLAWLRPDALVWVPMDGACVCRWVGGRGS